jgi:hypothetical protein
VSLFGIEQKIWIRLKDKEKALRGADFMRTINEHPKSVFDAVGEDESRFYAVGEW